MYIVLFCSFPVLGHMLHERALSKVTYHAAHCLSAIYMIFLHLLMTLVAHVNSGFVSLHIAFKVANKHWQTCYTNMSMRLHTSPPVLSIPYMVISSISATFSATLLGIALCRSDKLALLWKDWTMFHDTHWRGSSTFQNLDIPHHVLIAQANDEQLTCNAIMGCCTI